MPTARCGPSSLVPRDLTAELCLIALASLGLLLVRVRLAVFVVGETVRARFGLTVCALAELFSPDGGTSEASAIDKDSL